MSRVGPFAIEEENKLTNKQPGQISLRGVDGKGEEEKPAQLDVGVGEIIIDCADEWNADQKDGYLRMIHLSDLNFDRI